MEQQFVQPVYNQAPVHPQLQAVHEPRNLINDRALNSLSKQDLLKLLITQLSKEQDLEK